MVSRHFSLRSRLRSFSYALHGCCTLVREEHNARIHATITLGVLALGAYLGATGAVSLEEVEKVVRETFTAKPKIITPNLEALQRGYELGRTAIGQSSPQTGDGEEGV